MENLVEPLRREIIDFAQTKGLFVSKDSVELLSKSTDWKKILLELIEENQFMIEPKILEKKIARTKMSQLTQEVEIRKTNFKPSAKDRAPNFRVMSEYDVTGQSNSEGKVDDFLRLFRSKFKLLSTMLKERHNLSPINLKNLRTIAKNENVDLIGMVNKKWVTKNKHLAFEIEDLETKCTVLIMQKDREIMLKGERILEDNVVGIKGVKISDNFVIIKEIFWPDLPIRKSSFLSEEIYSACTSDFHVGSKYFLEDTVEKWLKFLRGENLSEKQKDKVGRLQYLFIVGDNIAGAGVYPGQFDDLLIKDLYDQYNAFEEIILQIPEYIQIFICTPKGTLLKTPKGYTPIEEIKLNDEVISYNEKKGVVEKQSVIKVGKRFSKKLLEISFNGSLKIKCTPEHPLLVYSKDKLLWKAASKLVVGDILPLPKTSNVENNEKTISLLKMFDCELYINNQKSLISKLNSKSFFKGIPERTRLSYLKEECPIPLSLLLKNNVCEDDFKWPLSIKTHHGKYVLIDKNISKELFYLIGLILTDGSFSIVKNKFPDGRFGKSFKIKFFNSNKKLIDNFKLIMKKMNIYPTAEYFEKSSKRIIGGREVNFKKNVYYIEFANKFFGELLLSLGLKPSKKKNSTLGRISTLHWDYIKNLLAGLFDGDGTRNKRMISFVTINDRFAEELFLLLQEHGFAPNKRVNNKICVLTIHRNKDIKKFVKEVPVKRINKKFKKMNNAISEGILKKSSPKIDQKIDCIALWRQIIKISELPGDEVYNIEVNKTHTYIAMGLINHNCPGQHDAVRRAEPQPAIPKEFVPRLYAQRNIHLIASPSWVETEGLKNLVYHGPSIHDLISSVSFLTMDHPEMGMVELLKKRDLMPGYGIKNPYVPEKKDFMVIKEIPDLVWIGDMHHNGYTTYRGATVLNGGCWEAQTDFEKKIGHTPTPGIFPMINLQNRKITEFYFMRNNLQKEIVTEQLEEVK